MCGVFDQRRALVSSTLRAVEKSKKETELRRRRRTLHQTRRSSLLVFSITATVNYGPRFPVLWIKR